MVLAQNYNGVILNKIDYKSAGVDIDAGNEAVEKIKDKVSSTFTNNVLTGLGGFGSLFSIKDVVSEYKDPIIVQSIDGVGTKTIVARKMRKFDTIGIDLLSAAANDIIVLGAKPLTFLDYIANDKLNPDVIEQIVTGMAKACKETGVSLVGGETAEMPDTYLPGEHDLVGVITGIVDRDKIIDGRTIKPNDIIIGLPSSGLHTNGYSLARKLFFNTAKYNVDQYIETLGATVGEALLEPHINYTNHIGKILELDVEIKGVAHITGGGLVENLPRILPSNCSVNINKGSWPILPIFSLMQDIGSIDEGEMFRAFNMGIGMTIVIDSHSKEQVFDALSDFITPYEIGSVCSGRCEVAIV